MFQGVKNMLLKVGDKIVDLNEEPIMIIFSSDDIEKLKLIDDTTKILCYYPEWVDENDIQMWIDGKITFQSIKEKFKR